MPESVEQLSDLFITSDELSEIIGTVHFYCPPNGKQREFLLKNTIIVELQKWADKLKCSKKKTLVIDDQELLDVLKDSYVSDYISCEFGRHGNRICYSKRYVRKQTKPTKKNVNSMWWMFDYAFREKFGCYMPHIPRYNRHLAMFRAFKEIIGWRRMRKQMDGEFPETIKFYRQIWDNPEEYIR
jgi:hypothetical protein